MKNMITHDETQFDRTVSVEGSTSTSEQAITLTTDVAASPTLISK